MDSYLSGRENLGDSKKSKDSLQISAPTDGLEQLSMPPSEDRTESEECGAGGSKVSYVSEEGRVTKIVVTCKCGQVTEIDCQYEE